MKVIAALGGAVLWAGSMAGVAAGEEPEERPVRRIERRVFAGGGRLGISLGDVGAADVAKLGLAAERGALVKEVHEGSAAKKAGLEKGDVIVRFAGQEVWSAAQLARLVRETPAGRQVSVDVTRGGSSRTLSVTLAEADRDRLFSFEPGDFHFEMPDLPDLADLPRPPIPPDAPMAPMLRRFSLGQGRRLGLSYQELGDQLAGYFKVEGGVLVTEVVEEGPAAKAGIKAGDVIVRVGSTDIRDGGDLRDALREAKAGSNTTVAVRREGRAMDLTVTLGEGAPARPAAPRTRTRRGGART